MTIKDQLHYAAKLHREHRDSEALTVLRAVVQQDPNQPSAWWAIAAISRDWNERYYALNEVLRLNPTHEKARALRDRLFPPSLPVSDETLPPWIAPSEHETEMIPAWIARAVPVTPAPPPPATLPEYTPPSSPPTPPNGSRIAPAPMSNNFYDGPPNAPAAPQWNVGIPPVVAAPWNTPSPAPSAPAMSANPLFHAVQRRARILSLLGFVAIVITFFVPFGNVGFYVPLYNGWGNYVETDYFSRDLTMLETYGAISYGDNVPVRAEGSAWGMNYWLYYDQLQERGAYIAAALYILPLLLTLFLPDRAYHPYRRLQALYALIEGAGVIYLMVDDEFDPLVGTVVFAVALFMWLIAGLLRVPRAAPPINGPYLEPFPPSMRPM